MIGIERRSRLEARIELDDELLVDVLGHLFARRKTHDDGFKRFRIHREPARNITNAIFFQAPGGELAGCRGILNLNLVTGQNIIARDINLVAVDANVSVIDELTSRGATLGQAEKIDCAIKAGFEQLQETFARDATFFLRIFEDASELTLKEPVNVTELLLFI